MSGEERATPHRVRDFLRAEVAPVANDHWARAELPAGPVNCWRATAPSLDNDIGRFVADAEALASGDAAAG